MAVMKESLYQLALRCKSISDEKNKNDNHYVDNGFLDTVLQG